MTGRYEEPETRRDFGPVSPPATEDPAKSGERDVADGSSATEAPAADSAADSLGAKPEEAGSSGISSGGSGSGDSGAASDASTAGRISPVEEAETQRELNSVDPPAEEPGGYVDPRTRPTVSNPNVAHPPPSYVDPSRSGSLPQPPVTGGQPQSGQPAQPQSGQPQSGQPQSGQPPHPSGPYPTPQGYGPPPNAPADPAQSTHFQQPLYGRPPNAYPASGPQPVPSDPRYAGPAQPQNPQPQNPQQPPPQSGPQAGPQTGAQSQANPQAPQQNPAQQGPGQQNPAQQGQQPFESDLSSAQLLRQSKPVPQGGWRRAVYTLSGHMVNPGESAAEVRRRELISRVNQPLQGCYKIAMLSLKGGVGKTAMTATLGATFSSLRGDRVIGVDANPDRGTLSQRIPLETTATVRHLLRDAQRVRKYSDVRSYTSQGPSRLEILASEQDPAVSEAFSEEEYRRTVTMLEHFYNVVLTDCGTGLMHSAMKGVLDVADSLVVVSSSSIDGARSASATLDWLDAHGYGALVARSVAVINSVRPGSRNVDVDKLAEHFGSRCRSVARIPFDQHLEEGAEIELDRLDSDTRLALLELAATVADDFPQAPGRQSPR